MHTAVDDNTKLVTIFFSSPGDVGDEKAKLVNVVEEMGAPFLRHGVSLAAWTFEKNAVPLAAAAGDSPQPVIDRQMPRKPDGSVAYDLFVGLMDRRIGTPLDDAPSGTVHEFLQAREAYQNTGRPHILFYFREREPKENQDPQIAGVERFRSEYPGLFARYHSLADLEAQFRRHLLSELLELFNPLATVKIAPAPEEWHPGAEVGWADLGVEGPMGYLDNSCEKVRRIIRQLHLLLGVEHRLSSRDRNLLATALLAGICSEADRERVVLAAQTAETASEIREVIARSHDMSKLLARPISKVRVDLLAALVTVGWRLDLDRQAISSNVSGPPDSGDATVEEWLAYLTDRIECEPGIVRFHLLAPSGEWINPLVGATAIALESLWQGVRAVMTRYDMSFAVARCQIEVDADVGRIPGNTINLLSQRAKDAVGSLPKSPHFGEARLPEIHELIPLPESKVDTAVAFRAPNPGPARLLVNGAVVAEEPQSGLIEYCLQYRSRSSAFLRVMTLVSLFQ